MTGKYLIPTHVRNDPLIFTGCNVKRPKAKPDSSTATKSTVATPPLEVTEQKGDLLIRDLWQNGTASVNGMHVLKTDSKSHLANTPEKCLQEAERAKKKMYLEACLQKRRHFYPFVDSVDALLSVEGTYTLKRIPSSLTKKWRQPYSRTYGYVKIKVAITLVLATHRRIRESRVPAHKISVQRLKWEDVSGINLFR